MGAYKLYGANGAVRDGGPGMLAALLHEDKNKLKVRLHTGDPGATGEANKAAETTEKEAEITLAINLTPANWKEGRKNLAAIEWIEVKAAETYKWIVLTDTSGPTQVLAIELTTPVTVAIGDTFRINKEKLIIKLLGE